MDTANQPLTDLEQVFRENHAMVFRARTALRATPTTPKTCFRRYF